MRKLLGLVTFSSLCLALSIGTIGCTGKAAKFDGKKTGAIKDKGDTVVIIYEKEIKSVTPDKHEGVKWTKEGKKVTFKLEDDLPETDKTAKFEVKGPGDSDKDTVGIPIPGKKKTTDTGKDKDKDNKDKDKVTPPPPPPAVELELDKATWPKDDTLKAGDEVTIKFSKGTVAKATTDAKDVKVTADKDSVKISVPKDFTGTEIKVHVEGEKAKGVDWTFKVAPAAPGKAFLNNPNSPQNENRRTYLASVIVSDEPVVVVVRRM